jgi:hypothetical protein
MDIVIYKYYKIHVGIWIIYAPNVEILQWSIMTAAAIVYSAGRK